MKTDDRRSPGPAATSSLGYLLAELDSRLRREVERLTVTGLQHDPFRGLYIKDSDAAEVAGSLGHDRLLELGTGGEQRLTRLAARFGLTAGEVQVLVAVVMPDLDLRYERVYAYLQDDVTRKRPTVDLLMRLFWNEPAACRAALPCFSVTGSLRRSGLVQLDPDQPQEVSLIARAVRTDERVVRYLLESDEVDDRLASVARVLAVGSSTAGSSIAADGHLARLVQLCRASETPRVIAFEGPPGAGKTAAAANLASGLGSRLLVVDVPDLMRSELPPRAAATLVFREAALQDALVYLSGGEALFDEGDRTWAMRTAMLRQHQDARGPLLMSGRPSVDLPGAIAGVPVTRITLSMPSNLERLATWSAVAGDAVPAEQLRTVAGAFRLTPGQIQAAAAVARERAMLRGASSLASGDLYFGCRAVSSHGLAAVADEVFGHAPWDDLVLPADSLAQLRELCATVRCRGVVLDAWGFGTKLTGGTGTTALFAGPSGTGKTMAAGVIARELGLPLFRIDLARVVSKWIGETEKNLDRVFKAAEDSNAILFLDEADALLGKRSEVKDSHDRYANLEISYLLQRMEMYDGLAILATNMRQLMDEAFMRRLAFTVLFPLPDEADRRRLWKTLWPADLPREEGLDLDRLSRFRLPGGNIKNVLLAAAYLAAAESSQVRMEHLLHGVKREYQKIGKQMTDAELAV